MPQADNQHTGKEFAYFPALTGAQVFSLFPRGLETSSLKHSGIPPRKPPSGTAGDRFAYLLLWGQQAVHVNTDTGALVIYSHAFMMTGCRFIVLVSIILKISVNSRGGLLLKLGILLFEILAANCYDNPCRDKE